MEKILLKSNFNMQSTKFRYLIYALSAMILSILHVVFLDIISVGDMTPDLLVILCVMIALREGQFVGLVAGFAIGIFFDIVSFDVIGTNALSKSVLSFFAGYFYKEGFHREIIGGLKFLLIVFLANLINNSIYYLIFIKPMELNFFQFFIRFGIAMSFYTTVFAVFVMLMNYKRKQ